MTIEPARTRATVHAVEAAAATGPLPASVYREYRPLVLAAVRAWETNPRPSNRVRPEWTPTGVLSDLFAAHGVDDGTVHAVLAALEWEGLLVRRTLRVDDVNYPVAKLTALGRSSTPPPPAPQVGPVREGLPS